MVRMTAMSDELPNVRVYISEVWKRISKNKYVRNGKNERYETPYCVTGAIQHTGS